MNKKVLKFALQKLKAVPDDDYKIFEGIRLVLEAMDEAEDGNITLSSGPIILNITDDNITVGYNANYGTTDVVTLCDLSLS
jgi:hypothetical protein